ncbi:hypothetical protein HYX58_00510 [Candidatus Dependentiae bacterium]|nr:hypothetical protein [Candidatus Dependentiae bacterium]
MKNVYLLLLILHIHLLAKIEETIQLPFGNYALPTSQQPGPLFGFGQNVIDEGDLQAYMYIDHFRGKKVLIDEYMPSILYGATDRLAILAGVPYFAKFEYGANTSSGAGDFFTAFEYAYYRRDSLYDGAQATVLAAISAPSGSFKKNPPTGFGSVGFFLGTTAEYMDTVWYEFAALGVQLVTPHDGTQLANDYFYQLGLSRNISYGPRQWVFNAMVELTGLYSKRDKVSGIINPNSGEHIVFIGPSLWWSTQQFLVQAGVAFPIVQHLNGQQNKVAFQFSLNMAWKFNTTSEEKNGPLDDED